MNQIRGLLGEFGIVVPPGRERFEKELPLVLADLANSLPMLARETLTNLATRLRAVNDYVTGYDQRLQQLARDSEPARRVMAVEGIGPITATAVVATVGDGHEFHSGREFAAWLGLTPRQSSSGGKNRLGGITKRGNEYLRRLFIHGARSVLRLTGSARIGKVGGRRRSRDGVARILRPLRWRQSTPEFSGRY